MDAYIRTFKNGTFVQENHVHDVDRRFLRAVARNIRILTGHELTMVARWPMDGNEHARVMTFGGNNDDHTNVYIRFA